MRWLTTLLDWESISRNSKRSYAFPFASLLKIKLWQIHLETTGVSYKSVESNTEYLKLIVQEFELEFEFTDGAVVIFSPLDGATAH